jgi:hypothetical protein
MKLVANKAKEHSRWQRERKSARPEQLTTLAASHSTT